MPSISTRDSSFPRLFATLLLTSFVDGVALSNMTSPSSLVLDSSGSSFLCKILSSIEIHLTLIAYSPFASIPIFLAIIDLLESRIYNLPCQFVENWFPLHIGHSLPSTKYLHFLHTFFLIFNLPYNGKKSQKFLISLPF